MNGQMCMVTLHLYKGKILGYRNSSVVSKLGSNIPEVIK